MDNQTVIDTLARSVLRFARESGQSHSLEAVTAGALAAMQAVGELDPSGAMPRESGAFVKPLLMEAVTRLREEGDPQGEEKRQLRPVALNPNEVGSWIAEYAEQSSLSAEETTPILRGVIYVVLKSQVAQYGGVEPEMGSFISGEITRSAQAAFDARSKHK